MNNLHQTDIIKNEDFVYLIETANNDSEMKSKLRAILKLAPFERRTFINTFISEMKYKNAPDYFIKALSFLLDDEISQKAFKIITE